MFDAMDAFRAMAKRYGEEPILKSAVLDFYFKKVTIDYFLFEHIEYSKREFAKLK